MLIWAVDRRTFGLCCHLLQLPVLPICILVDQDFQTFELPRSECACAHPLAALAPALCILPRHGVVELAVRLVNLRLARHHLASVNLSMHSLGEWPSWKRGIHSPSRTLSFLMTFLANSPRARCHTRLHRPLRRRITPDAASCAEDPPGTRMRWSVKGMHARRCGCASGRRARVRLRRGAQVWWCLGHSTSKVISGSERPRRGRKWAFPLAADTSLNVLQQTRAVRGAGAALPCCLGPRSADLQGPCRVGAKSRREGRMRSSSVPPGACRARSSACSSRS